MAAPRNRKHILIQAPPRVDSYTPHEKRRTSDERPPAPAIGRPAHAAILKASLEQAARDAAARRAAAGIAVHGAVPGIYVEFEAIPGWELAITSLEYLRPTEPLERIEVVAVTESPAPPNVPMGSKPPQRAMVFVPDGQLSHFIGRFEKYALTTPKREDEKRYEDMIDRIASLRLATLRALWTDDATAYPDESQTIWWELWLRRTDGFELQRLYEYAALKSLKLGDRRLEFDDRIITLVFASPAQLSSSIDVLNDVAEVRRAKELATFFMGQRADEQAAWSQDLAARVTGPPLGAPAVTILDTGVNRAHPLLAHALTPEDVYAANPVWGGDDDGGGPGMMGHGTQMAGLALYGDLAPLLGAQEHVILRHRLESVKLLPPARFGENHPDLYGSVTAAAVSYPEAQAPGRQRVFSMAVTANDQRDRGQPTSWSAAVDALAAGRSFDSTRQGLVYLSEGEESAHRLFVISAGNVTPPLDRAHIDRSDLEPMEDPAQTWNALTVGAYTERGMIQSPEWRSWEPLARPGDLSPFSTTSVGFARQWPIKPDVVAEGGNAVVNGQGMVDFPVGDLSLLTTSHEKQFELSYATSAACAQVARLCARVAAEYPAYWPETIRALVVHAARWTRTMLTHLKAVAGSKHAREALVRRYGFGVPSETRALRSAKDALTLIAQGSIRPFGEGKLREMHIFELPWPTEVLESLGEHKVQLRLTLSYFVEPNPARRGWQRRHRYQSHGLRFAVKLPRESMDEFRKRLNQRALDEEEERPGTAEDKGWSLGNRASSRGSLHSNIWTGTAAELAARGVIAIFPVSGWWKEQPKRDRSERGARYALVVSIETPGVETDIWTPVAQQVGISSEMTIAI
jgi:hypothetical protein